MPPARLLKYSEENIQLQKSLALAQNAATASSSQTKSAASSRAQPAGRRKEGGRGAKRARDEDDGSRRPELRLVVPEALKVLLVDDWEAVTKNSQARLSYIICFMCIVCRLLAMHCT